MTNWKEQSLEAAFNVYDYAQNLIAPSLKLGVTGLSRSGKTVFITSLVYHLLTRNNLTFFEPHTSGRILNVYLEPHPDDLLPRFDYEGNLDHLLSQPPSWPEGTRRISQLRLTIEYQSDHLKGRILGPSKLHIDIIDYPGEWLIDLAILDLDFQDWSEAILSALENQPKAMNWLQTASALKPTARADEGALKKCSDKLRKLLIELRDEDRAIARLTPGRFLLPGDLEGAPALTFIPMKNNSDNIEPDSLIALNQRRFEAYKDQIARPFYRNFFTRLDRQIVLVDLLSALHHGPEQLKELEISLEAILKNFNPGARHWLSSIWKKPIDRLVFAATKADHLHHENHDKLQNILSFVTRAALERTEMAGANVKVQAIAALKTTREATINQNSENYPVLIGTPLKGETFMGTAFDGKKEVHVFPGDLPEIDQLRAPSKNQPLEINNLNFAPPDPENKPQMPHIRLDRALNMLLGDKLE